MGVASGKFIPAPSYSVIRSRVIDLREGGQNVLDLSVQLADGTKLETAAGVHIADYSEEIGEEGREIVVLGIEYPLYEDLFPDHVAAYGRQFSSSGG